MSSHPPPRNRLGSISSSIIAARPPLNTRLALRSTLFVGAVLLCLLALLALLLRRPHFHKGVAFASWWHGQFSSPEADVTLAESIAPTGATWVSIVVTCYQATIATPAIVCEPSGGTATDDDLAHVIESARRLGLKVMLKPHVDVRGRWRGEIGFGDDEAAWQAWFESYTAFITHYAQLAQANGVEYFVVGTELVETTRREADWRAVVTAARRVYRGPITYSANHSREEFQIEWWDAVDAIGVAAYYALTDSADPTPDELREAWAPVVERLGQLADRWDRPVILTEVGYQSRDGTNRMPWNVASGAIDLQEQADCYQAVFDAFAGRDWWLGVYWWVWQPSTAEGGPLDGGFTPRGKPAAEVLRENYERLH